MRTNQTTQTGQRQKFPCQFTLYDDEFQQGYHGEVSKLIILARELLFSSYDTADDTILLAKAVQGGRTLLFTVDRDNFEFALRMPGGKSHVAGGTLSADMRGVSVHILEQMMTDYLASGKSIHIPGIKSAASETPWPEREAGGGIVA